MTRRHIGILLGEARHVQEHGNEPIVDQSLEPILLSSVVEKRRWDDIMPIRKTKGGYQWGKHGKVYKGKGARKKAGKQARAAYVHGYRGK